MFSNAKLIDEFEYFIKGFKALDDTEKYRLRISQMILEGKTSLLVEYEDILSYNTDLAVFIVEHPDTSLNAFKEAAYETMRIENQAYADKIRPLLTVRIKTLPDRIPLRKISAKQLDRMVSIGGMVVRTSEVKPQLIIAVFRCPKGHITQVEQKGQLLQKPKKCNECEETKQFELDKRLSIFTDYQLLRLQELPEELPPGQLPQSIDVIATGDIANMARPGDRVIVTGIVRAEPESIAGRGKLTVFRTSLDASFIEVLGKGPDKIELSHEDIEEIENLASQPDIYEKLIQSIAPTIFGYDAEKEAILLLTASAPQQVLPDGTAIRGDINILLVGDPGTAKSELLKYVSRTAPRGLYTSGRGTTAAGLTAAVVKEKSGIMMLEAGAVVLADQGIAAIDEFDKMRPEDRSVLHEVMEQQTVSVAKGGIVATLNARTSILAAANPVFGRYDIYRNIYENVNLPIPLLTRFDLIFIMRDVPDRSRDEQLATHILETHRKGGYAKEPPIPFETLRKYFAYCKRVNPKLTKEAMEKIKEFYVDMRAMSQDGTIAVTPRQLESLIRLASARARILLRDIVLEEDALRVISLMKRMLETAGVDVRSRKIDIGVFHGRPMSEKNLMEVTLEVIGRLQGPKKEPVEERKIIEEVVKTGRFKEEEVYRMLRTLLRNGQIYEVKSGYYNKTVYL